jgi:hypothetical protein
MASTLVEMASARVGERIARVVSVRGTVRGGPFYRPDGGGGAVALINADTQS